VAIPTRLKIKLLNGREAADQYPHLITAAREGGDAVDPLVSKAYRLGNGSVFIQDESVQEPFAFTSQVGPRRAHVVVAGSYGDVLWPARRHHIVQTAVTEIIESIRATYSPWLRMALATPLPDTDEDAEDDDFEAPRPSPRRAGGPL
jgi:hypothetical protein